MSNHIKIIIIYCHHHLPMTSSNLATTSLDHRAVSLSTEEANRLVSEMYLETSKFSFGIYYEIFSNLLH